MHQCTVMKVHYVPRIVIVQRPMVDFLSVMERCRFGNNIYGYNIMFICIMVTLAMHLISMQPVSPYINIQTVKACKHWAQCSVTAAGTAQCACIPGTSGARCENGPCEKTPCLNSGICLVMGIHATNNIGWEDVIGLRSKILYFRLIFGSLPDWKIWIF